MLQAHAFFGHQTALTPPDLACFLAPRGNAPAVLAELWVRPYCRLFVQRIMLSTCQLLIRALISPVQI